MDKIMWLSELYDDYDNWKCWSDHLSIQERTTVDIELKRSGVIPPARVLEVGFGTGAFLLYLKELGFECWGIERRSVHDEALERKGLTIRSGDISDLPAEHFDLVCAMDVFEHLEKHEIIEMLRKIREVLKPGGRLVARFPNGASPFGAMNQSADLTHLTTLSISSFGQASSVAGLEFIGGWNSASSWRSESLMRSLVKPAILLARRLFEAFLGALFYGERRPLDVNVTVCVERPR